MPLGEVTKYTYTWCDSARFKDRETHEIIRVNQLSSSDSFPSFNLSQVETILFSNSMQEDHYHFHSWRFATNPRELSVLAPRRLLALFF